MALSPPCLSRSVSLSLVVALLKPVCVSLHCSAGKEVALCVLRMYVCVRACDGETELKPVFSRRSRG